MPVNKQRRQATAQAARLALVRARDAAKKAELRMRDAAQQAAAARELWSIVCGHGEQAAIYASRVGDPEKDLEHRAHLIDHWANAALSAAELTTQVAIVAKHAQVTTQEALEALETVLGECDVSGEADEPERQVSAMVRSRAK